MQKLMEMHYNLYSMNNTMSDHDILTKFKEAYDEDAILCTKWLFWAREAGTQKVFQTCISFLSDDRLKHIKFENHENDTEDDIFEDFDFFECYSCESFYKHLPDFSSLFGNTLCVPYHAYDNIERALIIHLSEHNSGNFQNKFVSGSDIDPWEDYYYDKYRFANLTEFKSLDEKIDFLFYKRHYVHSSNKLRLIGLLFFLLQERDSFDLRREHLDTILIFSNKEFNNYIDHWSESWYALLKRAYTEKNISFPKIILWNFESENTVIPVQQTETGITLINSHESIKSLQEIYKNLKSPQEFVKEQLSNPKFDIIESILKH